MKMKLGGHMKWIKRFIKSVKQKWLESVIGLAFFILCGFIVSFTDYAGEQPLEVCLIISVIFFLIYFIPYYICF